MHSAPCIKEGTYGSCSGEESVIRTRRRPTHQSQGRRPDSPRSKLGPLAGDLVGFLFGDRLDLKSEVFTWPPHATRLLRFA
jgi:hypothetical protein